LLVISKYLLGAIHIPLPPYSFLLLARTITNTAVKVAIKNAYIAIIPDSPVVIVRFIE